MILGSSVVVQRSNDAMAGRDSPSPLRYLLVSGQAKGDIAIIDNCQTPMWPAPLFGLLTDRLHLLPS